MRLSRTEVVFLTAGFISALIVFVVGVSITKARRTPTPPPPEKTYPLDQPVRTVLPSFKRNTCMPDGREGSISGSIDLETFVATESLIEFHDDRIWWESDHDRGDTENDHVMDRSMEEPLRRRIELVLAEKGSLEVHDCYRATGIHAPRSLHREGRAIDLTCDDLGLERLAILCWSAGFDWVFFEHKASKGAHVHCSVRREPDRTNWIMPVVE
jgi:hypothetical protein